MSRAVQTQDMVLVHSALLREIAALPALVLEAADHARRARVARHAREMLDVLRNHHTCEDLMLWPLLRERATIGADHLDRMERQHLRVEASVGTVRLTLDGWVHTGAPEAAERIVLCLNDVRDQLREHHVDEEELILPLAAQCLTQGEWDAIGRTAMERTRPDRRLRLLGHLLEEADDHERREMLATIPLGARVAFRLVGRRLFARGCVEVRGAGAAAPHRPAARRRRSAT